MKYCGVGAFGWWAGVALWGVILLSDSCVSLTEVTALKEAGGLTLLGLCPFRVCSPGVVFMGWDHRWGF